MQQLRLLSGAAYEQKVVSFEHIKASFQEVANHTHEVVLELNSHKFLISFKAGMKKLEKFELLAVKGFVEVGMKVIRFLKRLVTTLYFEY